MELLPPALAATAVLRRDPFTFAHNREARAIDDEMERPLSRDAVQLDVEVPTPARQRGVVGRFEVDVHQGEDRPQETLRLAQGQTEDQPERQRGGDREIREPLLPTRLTGRHRSPRVPGVGREPQRHVASPHERPFVRPPIPDAICGLVLRVHPRLHGTIVCRGRSIRPADPRSSIGMRLRSRAPTPPAGTRRRVAKLSVEEPDAAEPARPDLWGARVSNDPGLPRPLFGAMLQRIWALPVPAG